MSELKTLLGTAERPDTSADRLREALRKSFDLISFEDGGRKMELIDSATKASFKREISDKHTELMNLVNEIKGSVSDVLDKKPKQIGNLAVNDSSVNISLSLDNSSLRQFEQFKFSSSCRSESVALSKADTVAKCQGHKKS